MDGSKGMKSSAKENIKPRGQISREIHLLARDSTEVQDMFEEAIDRLRVAQADVKNLTGELKASFGARSNWLLKVEVVNRGLDTDRRQLQTELARTKLNVEQMKRKAEVDHKLVEEIDRVKSEQSNVNGDVERKASLLKSLVF